MTHINLVGDVSERHWLARVIEGIGIAVGALVVIGAAGLTVALAVLMVLSPVVVALAVAVWLLRQVGLW